NDLAELQERLATSENNIRDLESSQQRLANTEPLEATHAEELRQWQTRIADLERQLADARVKLGESDALRERLAEAEKLRQDLEVENLRHEEEVARWQARIVDAEENRRRLSGLREPFDALMAKHAEIAERQNRFKEDLAAFGGLMALPVNLSADTHAAEASMDNPSYAAPVTGATRATTTSSFQAAALVGRAATDDDDRSAVDESGGPMASAQLAAGGPANKQRKRRFGLFGLIVLLPVAAAFAFGNWQNPMDRANLGTVKFAAVPAGKADSGQVPAKPQD
ncbi:MAG TPA: hypothetical protein VLA17_10135, partial [Candidatus Limnocylindria bacterium]|nr:hypothetical protein [Candidatus Limnocylindria bacterium]